MISDELLNKTKDNEKLKDIDLEIVKKICRLIEEKKDESDLLIKSKIIEIVKKG